MQRLLLDTYVFLWWLDDDHYLTADLRALIMDDETEVYISTVSGWKITGSG